MGSWGKVERSGHETEEKNEKGKKCAPAARSVERGGIIDGCDAQETNAEEENSPDVPALPETEEAERDENERKKDRNVTVKGSAEGTENVAAVQLGNRQEIE